MTEPMNAEAVAIEWPREIWAKERAEFDVTGEHVFSVHATVARWEGDREGEFHRYVDGDTMDSLQRYHDTMIADLRAENATLRAELELLTAVKNAHKMRADNHWETLRSISVLAREGKLEHIIQHVSDAGSGYTQSDDVTMWELQSALATANTELVTLRASEAAALARVGVLEAALQEIAGEKFYPMGIGIEPTPTREAKMAAKALTPTTDKEPKT